MPGSGYGQQSFVWGHKFVKHVYRLLNRRPRVLFPVDNQNWELDGTNLIPMGGFQPAGKSGFLPMQELTQDGTSAFYYHTFDQMRCPGAKLEGWVTSHRTSHDVDGTAVRTGAQDCLQLHYHFMSVRKHGAISRRAAAGAVTPIVGDEKINANLIVEGSYVIVVGSSFAIAIKNNMVGLVAPHGKKRQERLTPSSTDIMCAPAPVGTGTQFRRG